MFSSFTNKIRNLKTFQRWILAVVLTLILFIIIGSVYVFWLLPTAKKSSTNGNVQTNNTEYLDKSNPANNPLNEAKVATNIRTIKLEDKYSYSVFGYKILFGEKSRIREISFYKQSEEEEKNNPNQKYVTFDIDKTKDYELNTKYFSISAIRDYKKNIPNYKSADDYVNMLSYKEQNYKEIPNYETPVKYSQSLEKSKIYFNQFYSTCTMVFATQDLLVQVSSDRVSSVDECRNTKNSEFFSNFELIKI
jgi:lipopolysaccharide export LptBFGC system permease protein LptF